jgi:tetratricopeptide (TPR) repeat protein
MTDPTSTRPTTPDEFGDAERAVKIDELLLAGLDHYFAGQFQEAINVWGRVLFLDRAHARARAYIERARSALAERQRKAEELLHEGVAAFQRGDGGSARELLRSAVEQGGPQDVALAYLGRLDRLEGAVPAPEVPVAAVPARTRRGIAPGDRLFRRVPRPIRVFPLVGLAFAVGIVVLAATSKDVLGPLLTGDLLWGRTPTVPAAAGPSEALPVPRSPETILARARTLAASGHLKDALAALDTIAPGDPVSAEAGRLRGELQQLLLDSRGSGRGGQGVPRPASEATGRPGGPRE